MKRRLAFLALALALFALPAIGLTLTIQAAPPPARPTPTPGILSPQDVLDVDDPLPAATYPDLIITAIHTSETPRLGITETVQVIVMNRGDADVAPTNNFYVDLYIDPAAPPESGRPGEPGTLHMGVQGYLFKRGQSVPITFEYVFTRTRTYNLYAQADTDGNVVESNENNNLFGPVNMAVRTGTSVADISHQDFQAGFSNMDLSHPLGLVALGGVYQEPTSAPLTNPANDPLAGPTLYNPDFGVSGYNGPVNQVAPVLARNDAGDLYMVWEDGRNGELRNRDIYFARSLDEGSTWIDEQRVNQDSAGESVNQRSPALVYDRFGDTLYVAWQDQRNGDYDIYLARSSDGGQTWQELAANPINDDDSHEEQLNPSLAVDDLGVLYLVWQDRRNGNDDIYFAASEDGGENWTSNVLVTDAPATTTQAQRSPTIAVTHDPVTTDAKLYVVWEDGRSAIAGDPADVYYTWGAKCEGDCQTPPCQEYCFDVDQRVNNDTTLLPQRDPSVVISTPHIEVTRTMVYTPGSEVCVGLEVTTEVEYHILYEGRSVHFAWQDYRRGSNDPDIYYAWTFLPVMRLKSLSATPSVPCTPPPDIPLYRSLPFDDPEKLRGNVVVNDIPPQTPSSCYDPPFGVGRLPCDPPADPSTASDRPKSTWGTAGTIQEYPTLVSGPPESDWFYILWSDRRSYDGMNADIYVARPLRELDQPTYEIAENLVVNDNAKQIRMLQGDKYLTHAPASVRQYRPTGAYQNEGVPYVAWDDDRRADPLAGYALERNIFFARPGAPPSPGVFLSRIFEANNDTHWNQLEWWGVTPFGTRIYFQTRTGETPWPDGSWTDWTGPIWDDAIGLWIYQGPAEIVGINHQRYPKARYLQYRFWIEDCSNIWKPPYIEQRTPQAWVSKVIVHYSPKTYTAHLPMIVKRMAPPAPTPTPTATPRPTPAGRIPNDPYYVSHQWHLRQLDLPLAWGISTGAPGAVVAVVDTGIDGTHPDLAGKVLAGYDFIHNDADASDDEGHGTHVAGIIAANTNNGVGVAGVSWGSQLLAVKVLNEDGAGPISSIAAGIIWAVDHGAKVINLSLGSKDTNMALQSAISYAHTHDVVLVAAAGNSYQDGNPVIYPAAHDHVIAVGATGDTDEHASYSETGAYLDLAAPGGNPSGSTDTNPRHWIWSTYWRGSPEGGIPVVGYLPSAGTSQASPHVAGLAALIRTIDAGLSAAEVEGVLKSTAVDLGAAGRDNVFGAGRVDALAALREVQSGMAKGKAVEEEAAILPAADAGAHFAPGRLLVRFAPALDAAEQTHALQAIGARVEGALPQIGWTILSVAPGTEAHALAKLRATVGVEQADLDYLLEAIR